MLEKIVRIGDRVAVYHYNAGKIDSIAELCGSGKIKKRKCRKVRL